MFIESLCVVNGKAPLLDLHQDRMNRTYSFHYKQDNPYQLASFIEDVPATGKFKLRIIYDRMIQKNNHALYIKPDIDSLKVVEGKHIDYSFKYADRKGLEELYEQRNNCDDIIIIKDGLVTDAYFANLIFWDGDEWLTPSFSLLQGVRRHDLLAKKMIKLAKIRWEDIGSFEKVGLINALLDFEEIVLDCNQIII